VLHGTVFYTYLCKTKQQTMEQIKGIILNKKDYKITESAYIMLSDFLNHIKKTKRNEEFLNDIEIQISIIIDMELEAVGKNKVVDTNTVKELISVMKENRNIKYVFKNKNKNKRTKKRERFKQKKGLFRRDLSNNILGGVCSAIGNLLHIDPIIIRILFIIGAFIKGILIPVYIILWILIPSEKEKI